ncbi:MAG: PSD1 domain-containing protein [Planctomycetaceae bacterium]|nr:PSD1 domain-containing protein [Planctomycetaceae bacterium]
MSLAVLLTLEVSAAATPAGRQAPGWFEENIAPLLVRRCIECHKPPAAAGGLDLTTREGLLSGGDSGDAINEFAPSESYFLERIRSGEMPPPVKGVPHPLNETETLTLSKWIQQGANWPDGRTLDLFERTTSSRAGRDWWSLQPIRRFEWSPAAKNPIDAFIQRGLEDNKLTSARAADPATILRRMSIDTTGLLPNADQIAQFADAYTAGDGGSADRDPADEAIREAADRLLQSPKFGERWARHWLDVVRFAETSGYERDQPKPFAWKYRDWVVDALNSDLPYDQFVLQQLAGDEIEDRTERSVIATGFLRLGTWNDEPNDPEDYVYDRLEDLVHSTSTAFLGITVKCARCHDHKFDPIPQTDYYRMASAFWPGPIAARDRNLLGGPGEKELGYADVLGWTDVTADPEPLYVLRNGERHSPLFPVKPASLSVRPDLFREFETQSIATQHHSVTGRRRQLAEWMISPDNPLVARVIVNRIWQHYFGEGLVRSPDNFGFTGERPTHPELLDWLASELIRNDWHMKPIHRLILNSRTYRQSSIHDRDEEFSLIDAANRYLWRANRRRMDAESLRDNILLSSGSLDTRMGGPGFFPAVSPEALEGLSRKAAAWTASAESEQLRRSLYMFSQRSLLPPMMTTFDFCDTTLPCGQRDVSIVAPQALTLLNNQFLHQQAEHLACRIVSEAGTPEDRAIKIWQSILKRTPKNDELMFSVQHVQRQMRRLLIHETNSESRNGVQDTSVGRDDVSLNESLQAAIQKTESCVLFLTAENNVITGEQGRVVQWENAVDTTSTAIRRATHKAIQPVSEHQPMLVPDAMNGWPVIRFDGQRRFMHLRPGRSADRLLVTDEFTLMIVACDNHPQKSEAGHRELISNWSGRDGNYGTSVFLGLTDNHRIRFTDALVTTESLMQPVLPFLLTATNGNRGAGLWQQRRAIIHQESALPSRRLDTDWVIGQQGNIDGEFWHGDIATILVFDKQLEDSDLRQIQSLLRRKYQLQQMPDADIPESLRTPEELAWASLCLVLFNSNEFIFID